MLKQRSGTFLLREENLSIFAAYRDFHLTQHAERALVSYLQAETEGFVVIR
jgi:hypothetical protein